jgi:hypothetical protein
MQPPQTNHWKQLPESIVRNQAQALTQNPAKAGKTQAISVKSHTA